QSRDDFFSSAARPSAATSWTSSPPWARTRWGGNGDLLLSLRSSARDSLGTGTLTRELDELRDLTSEVDESDPAFVEGDVGNWSHEQASACHPRDCGAEVDDVEREVDEASRAVAAQERLQGGRALLEGFQQLDGRRAVAEEELAPFLALVPDQGAARQSLVRSSCAS